MYSGALFDTKQLLHSHMLAAESAEERVARLQQMSTTQRERLAAESAEDREARLLQLSIT